MTTVSSVLVSFVLFGIICGQMTIAQRRQRPLNPNSRTQRGQIQQTIRLSTSGTLPRTRVSVLPGPRHTSIERPRTARQRLSGIRSRAVVSTAPNRLRSAGTRRNLKKPAAARFAALHRQPRPTRTSLTRPSRTKAVTASPSSIRDRLRIFARNLKVIRGTGAGAPRPANTKTSPIKGRSSSAPRTRTPLRIRARLRQISNQGSKPAKVKETKPAQAKNGGVNSSNGKGSRKDMIAIDDIIALVKAIKGNKEPSPVMTQGKLSNVGASSGLSSNNAVISPKNGGKKIGPPTTSGNIQSSPSLGIKAGGTGKKLGSPSVDLLRQFALMNGEGGAFSSLLSDPSFLSELSAGNGGFVSSDTSNSGTIAKRKGRRMGKHVDKKQRTSVIIHPSLVPGNRKTEMKMANTGNPVQDKMISSLLEQTMKNIREEIQENIQKTLTDIDQPVPRIVGSSVDPALLGL